MTDANGSIKEITTATRSRLIKALHYEPSTRRLHVLTTHGNMHIHDGVPAETAEFIADDDHPGHAYLALKHELGRKISPFTLTGFLSARRARRAISQMAQ